MSRSCLCATGPNKPLYYCAVGSLLVLVTFNIVLIAAIFDLHRYIPLILENSPKNQKLLFITIMTFGMLAIVLINFLFKEKDVLNIDMSKTEKRRGYTLIAVYWVLLFSAIIVTALLKKHA